MSQMLKSSGAMGLATMTSRVLGLVREQVYAAFMGTTPIAGAFYFAFAIPNLFRRLLGEGALTAAFIPIFKAKEKQAGEIEMWRAANAVISGLLVAASVIVGLGMLGITLALGVMDTGSAVGTGTTHVVLDSGVVSANGILAAQPALVARQSTSGTSSSVEGGAQLTTNGTAFKGTGVKAVPIKMSKQAERILMLRLLRVMFPYMLLVCLAAVCMGMLNARGHFFIPALAAAALNVVMIAAVLFLVPVMGTEMHEQVFALAIGVLVAGVAQAGFQLPTLRKEGFRFRWVSPWKDETVREVVRKMLPASIGVAAFQINVLITQSLAYTEHASIVAEFGYAVRLMELPQGVFGISLATFLLPTLSGFAADKNFKEFRGTLESGMSYLFFVNLLASILLFVLAEPIIRLLFERGEFNALSTSKVSFGLLCLAPGLLAFSLVNILARAFFALGDVKVPMRISLFCLAINLVVVVVLLLGMDMGVGALGIANTFSSSINLGLLLFALRKKLKQFDLVAFRAQLGRLLFAAGVAAAVTWITLHYWNRFVGHATRLEQIGEVFVPMLCATAVYLGLAWVMKVPSARDVLGLVTRRLRR